MGVKGLWKLVGPVGRPVLLESVEGKAMAIDSSIWLYQFQATMRDKDGRALVNAHIVGFLRRICKLLFYGIKPVFVFDGGAPAIKKATITERKKRKSGFAASHAKLAEKILAAQMRREAVRHVQAQGDKSKNPALSEDMVYLEDYNDPNFKSPSKKDKGKEKAADSTPSPSKKKHKFHDHDPYRLPAVDLEAAVASATRAAVPDPRLATEEELRDFIENMRPEDFDVSSPAFRELPTEVKYEIVGDLRLKSRQTSYKRLQSMLRAAPTALDFSKAQIRFLQQRNVLTQQLLATTDNIGNAHVNIPVRVASERNRQYVLIKNEGADGGWVLGRRDDGTRAQPIEIDLDDANEVDEDEDDSDDMEEVDVGPEPAPDPDMRDYRRHLGLSSIGVRQSPAKPIPSANRSLSSSRASSAPAKKRPLFSPSDEDVSDEDDPALTVAIAQSLESEELRRAQVALSPAQRAISTSSRLTLANAINSMAELPPRAAPTRTPVPVQDTSDDDADMYVDPVPPVTVVDNSDDDADLYVALERQPVASSSAAHEDREISFSATSSLNAAHPSAPTADNFANSSFSSPSLLRAVAAQPPTSSSARSLGAPSLLRTPSSPVAPAAPATPPRPVTRHIAAALQSPPAAPASSAVPSAPTLPHGEDASALTPRAAVADVSAERQSTPLGEPTPLAAPASVDSDDDIDMEEVVPQPSRQNARILETARLSPLAISRSPVPNKAAVESDEDEDMVEVVPPTEPPPATDGTSALRAAVVVSAGLSPDDDKDEDEMEEAEIPVAPDVAPPAADEAQPSGLVLVSPPSSPIPTVAEDEEGDGEEHWDAAQEMDPVAEESEFAQFFSQVKGRSLDAVRAEIDAELFALNQANKAAQRDSEDVTQQMVAQIQILLRLFGIPYITAPLEAEAQCAALAALGLVEGVITDDSDVFLFGAPDLRVFKNMFNQSKTVECFLASDLTRELGLERDKLVRLAYLLGSDYVEGLPGVGPVLAMEILEEFPGADGLMRFRDWWMKVQTGKDRPEDNKSAFRKRFKKKFRSLHLTDEWPNPLVRDAYYHPAVDSSDEPFKWGLPDLDALQHFLNQELGWGQGKVDDLLLPIIHRMGQRGQAGGANKQGTLSAFFDISVGTGTYAPRKKQAYASKRLQKIVQDYRKERKQQGGSTSPGPRGSTEPPSRGGEGDQAESDNAPGGSSLSRQGHADGADAETSASGSKGKRKRKAATAKSEHSTARAGKGKKQTAAKKRKVAAANDRDGSEDEVRGRVTSDEVSNRELRPRRATRAQGTTQAEIDEPESEDDENAFIRSRRR